MSIIVGGTSFEDTELPELVLGCSLILCRLCDPDTDSEFVLFDMFAVGKAYQTIKSNYVNLLILHDPLVRGGFWSVFVWSYWSSKILNLLRLFFQQQVPLSLLASKTMVSLRKANNVTYFSRLVLAFKTGTWQFGINPLYKTIKRVRWIIAKHNEVKNTKKNAVQKAKHSHVQEAKQNEMRKANKTFLSVLSAA